MYQTRSATCDRARAWVSLRTDGELSEFECALLDAHLTRCDACAAFAADVGSLTLALRAEPLEQLSRPIDIAVRRRPSFRLPMRALASAAAVIVTIAGTAHMLGSSGPKQARLSSQTESADMRLLARVQRDHLTSIFEAGKVKVVHPQGSSTKPPGGPVTNLVPADKQRPAK